MVGAERTGAAVEAHARVARALQRAAVGCRARRPCARATRSMQLRTPRKATTRAERTVVAEVAHAGDLLCHHHAGDHARQARVAAVRVRRAGEVGAGARVRRMRRAGSEQRGAQRRRVALGAHAAEAAAARLLHARAAHAARAHGARRHLRKRHVTR